MAEAGYRLSYEDVVTARRPNESEREQLAVSENQPVLVAWRRAFDSGTGHALEVTLRVINSAVHELVYRYT